jgi:hypothetical protein
MDLATAVQELERVFGSNPLAAIRRLENYAPRLAWHGQELSHALGTAGVSEDTLLASLELKRIAGQVNVIVHTCGILAALPHILEDGERIESISLGAGNTGKEFDLSTDRRIAEFKFISWRGGPEAIRQNQVFKDFLKLLWDSSGRRKQLFLTGTKEALAFLTGRRALTSVLSRNVALMGDFSNRYGERYQRVGEFFRDVRDEVEIVDLRFVIPALSTVVVPPEADRSD